MFLGVSYFLTVFEHSNFVDHHVSTREQITLQDSVEGTELSTLQFGLDGI